MSNLVHHPDDQALQAGSLLPIPYVVDSRKEECAGTFTFALRPADGSKAVSFAPGQFNMLYAFGAGESAISISGPADDSDVLIHTIHRLGTVTTALERLKVGDSVGLRGPFGSTWPLEAARGQDLVFVAGGIGLAPLRPAILHALKNRADYGRIAILAGARTPKDILYYEELQAWRNEPEVEIRITVDRADPTWPHNVGVVTTLIPPARFDAANATAMVCGPEIMMRFTAAELAKRNLPHEKIYVTLERNMKCAVGFCGHCQFGPEFICRDGPIFPYNRISHWFSQREI